VREAQDVCQIAPSVNLSIRGSKQQQCEARERGVAEASITGIFAIDPRTTAMSRAW
jgi:hypothetical protein